MAETSEPPGTPEKLPSERQVNILLVDDQPANLLALEAVLQDLGHNLVTAPSGEEARRRSLEADFAVILLAVQMHGLDGFETARLIRGREQTRHTPILFLTAHDSSRHPVEEAYALGAVDYLVKPLVPVILRAKVAGFVELSQKTEQVQRQAAQIRLMERRDFERKLAEENARLRESEARKAAILETALDCIITLDHQGKVIEFNPAAERTFGHSRTDVLGREMAELIVPPPLRESHRRGLAHYLATGESPVLNQRVEMPALRADGTEFPVELAITRIPGEGPPLFTAYLRDITERKRAEGRRNARLAVSQVLAEAATVPEAAPRILEAVCKGLGWDVGGLWTLDRQAGVLRCLAVWHTPTVRVEGFAAATRQRAFAPGVGLPGRVWSNGRPAWIPDVTRDANFPRAVVASQEGLHGAFACPVRLGTEFLGVIEFFSRDIREPDADLLEMMATLGGQVGQFMERRRAEQALRDSEQRFARFTHHLPGLAWIKDLQGRYVYVNDAAERAFRTPRAELYGKTDEEVFPPETAARFKENDRRAMAGGTGVQVIETLEHEDGILHHSVVSKFPIPGSDGQPVLVGGMAIDITEQLRAEQALRVVQEQLHIVTDSMSAPVSRCSRDLTYLWVSQPYADWLGRSPDEIVGRPITEVIGQEAFASLRPHFERVLLGEQVRYEEEVNFRGLGRRWVNAVYTPTFDAAGVPDGWVAVVLDIDYRKRAEEALKEADRRKDEFLAMLAHELRNPLAPIRNALYIMKQPGVNGAMLQQLRDMAERQVQHMARLLDDLLDVSRISRGRIELRNEVVDVAAVISRTVEAVRPLVEERRHELTVSLPAGPLRVEADPTRLEQVLTNLLNNAAKYTDPGGQVWLTAGRDGGEVVLRVRDTGIGIAPEMLPRIFDLFVQAERRLDRSQGGVGIGLTLVKKLVELHGGRIEASSAGLGRGSEFAVRLPALRDQHPSEKARGSGGDGAAELPHRRVLVVDDNQDAADSLALLLRLAGQEVRAAYDGPSALTQARDFQPALVFLDIGMPDLDGYEVARRLRGESHLQGAVLVALTGWGQDTDRRRSRDAGFDHHLVKPVEPGALLTLLASLPAAR